MGEAVLSSFSTELTLPHGLGAFKVLWGMCADRRPPPVAGCRGGPGRLVLYVAAHVSNGGEYTDPTDYDTGGVLVIVVPVDSGKLGPFGEAPCPGGSGTFIGQHMMCRSHRPHMIERWAGRAGHPTTLLNRPSNPVVFPCDTQAHPPDCAQQVPLPGLGKTVLMTTFMLSLGQSTVPGDCTRRVAGCWGLLPAEPLGDATLGEVGAFRPWGLCIARQAGGGGGYMLYGTSHGRPPPLGPCPRGTERSKAGGLTGAVVAWEPGKGWRPLSYGWQEPNYILAH